MSSELELEINKHLGEAIKLVSKLAMSPASSSQQPQRKKHGPSLEARRQTKKTNPLSKFLNSHGNKIPEAQKANDKKGATKTKKKAVKRNQSREGDDNGTSASINRGKAANSQTKRQESDDDESTQDDESEDTASSTSTESDDNGKGASSRSRSKESKESSESESDGDGSSSNDDSE